MSIDDVREHYRGVFPIAPTAFKESGDLDFEGQRRVIDCMIDQGVDGVCILANYAEQFSLSDLERDSLLDLCLEQVAGRVPVIVTTSHFSTRLAIQRSLRAQSAGATMLMLMPPYHGATLRPVEARIRQYFQEIAESVSIPIMVQDAPLSGINMSVDFLAALARDYPLIRYFKVETPNAAVKLNGLIEAGERNIYGPFDGEESITLMADLDAGATGTMPSALLPDLIKPVLENYFLGKRADSAAIYRNILPLINFENRQCGLRATKAVMMEGGVIESDMVRQPLEPLPAFIRKGLLELARVQKPIAIRWGK